jgi:hypothetical protein
MRQEDAYYGAQYRTSSSNNCRAFAACDTRADAGMVATCYTSADRGAHATAGHSSRQCGFSPAPSAVSVAFKFRDISPSGGGRSDGNLFRGPRLKRADDGVPPLNRQPHSISRSQLGQVLPHRAILCGKQQGEKQDCCAVFHRSWIIADRRCPSACRDRMSRSISISNDGLPLPLALAVTQQGKTNIVTTSTLTAVIPANTRLSLDTQPASAASPG